MTEEEGGTAAISPSGFARLIGFEPTVWERDFARVELTLGPQFLNRNGLPHGGLLSTLIDTAMGLSGCFSAPTEPRRACVTLNLNVNFLAPAQGGVLQADGRRIGGGRSTFFTEARLEDDLGTLVATATGVFRYVTPR